MNQVSTPAASLSRLDKARAEAKLTDLYQEVLDLKAAAQDLNRPGIGDRLARKREFARELRAANRRLIALAGELNVTLQSPDSSKD